MNPRSGWYPLCLADDVEPGTATGTRLFGRELVVWRDQAGASHVWEDRCPHRGMRLSFGFVRGDRIACLYHGWQFDATGRCRLIPAHPDLKVPPSITVERYASEERLGIVWVRDHDVDEGLPPPGDDGSIVPVRSITMRASVDRVLACLSCSPPRRNGLVAVHLDGDRLNAAIQPLSDSETALHLTFADTPGSPLDRKRAALWAEALRREVESHAVAAECIR